MTKQKPIVTEEMEKLLFDMLDAGASSREALEAALAVAPKPELTEEEQEMLARRRKQSNNGRERELLAIIDRLTGGTK